MKYFVRLKETAKKVPIAVWVAGVLIPGGLTALAIYMAWKASRKDKPNQSLREFVEDIMKHEREPSDRSKDRS